MLGSPLDLRLTIEALNLILASSFQILTSGVRSTRGPSSPVLSVERNKPFSTRETGGTILSRLTAYKGKCGKISLEIRFRTCKLTYAQVDEVSALNAAYTHS